MISPKILSMRPRRFDRPYRTALVATLLSLFLFGSNYCVLAAVVSSGPGPARLACHPTDVATAARAHGCCDRSSGKQNAPAKRASYPCCIQVAPPASTTLDAVDADAVLVLASATGIDAPPAPRAPGRSFASDDESPPAPPPAVLRGRAPPIS